MDDSFNLTVPRILHNQLHSSLMATADETPPRALLSKVDFLHAVEAVAGDLSKPGLAESGDSDMEAVFVACPCDTWKQAFGELRGSKSIMFRPVTLQCRPGSSLAAMAACIASGISWTIPARVNGSS